LKNEYGYRVGTDGVIDLRLGNGDLFFLSIVLIGIIHNLYANKWYMFQD
jgi:hypothetical protein